MTQLSSKYKVRQAQIEAIIAADGSGDYTTLQDAYDAGYTRFGIKGEYVTSVQGELTIDNTVESDFVNLDRLVLRGIDKDAKITLDTNNGAVNLAVNPVSNKGSDTVTNTLSGIYQIITGTTDWAAAGVEVGMHIHLVKTDDSEWRHSTEPMQVRAIDGVTMTVDRPYGYSASHWSSAAVQWEAYYLNKNGWELRDIKLEHTGSGTFFMKSGGYGWKGVLWKNIRMQLPGTRNLMLVQGPGRLWQALAENCSADAMGQTSGTGEDRHNHYTMDMGHYGVAIGCSGFDIRYIPSNIDATWINCIMYGTYFEGYSNARGTLINCMLADKTDTIADWGSFRTINCRNGDGVLLDDGTGQVETQRVFLSAEITGTITPARDKVSWMDTTNGNRVITLTPPEGAVSGDNKVTTVILNVSGYTSPGQLIVNFDPSALLIPPDGGQANQLVIDGSTESDFEPITVVLVQRENDKWRIQSISRNEATNGSVTWGTV